jgi:hypothetical protein
VNDVIRLPAISKPIFAQRELMPTRWWFKESIAVYPSRWTWRTLNVDGSVDQQSAEFGSYGAAVQDALTHGFHPSDDDWAIESARLTSHFASQKRVVLSKNGQGS